MFGVAQQKEETDGHLYMTWTIEDETEQKRHRSLCRVTVKFKNRALVDILFPYTVGSLRNDLRNSCYENVIAPLLAGTPDNQD